MSKELLEHFGQENIENWAMNLRQAATDLLEERHWSNLVEIDDELFFRFFEDMLVDIMRLKIFHEIDHANKIKQRAYAASWWLRRKPFRFKTAHDKSTMWANELFALTLLFGALTEDIYKSDAYDRKRATETARHLLYHLKYRNTNPQTLELFLMGLNAVKSAEK